MYAELTNAINYVKQLEINIALVRTEMERIGDEAVRRARELAKAKGMEASGGFIESIKSYTEEKTGQIILALESDYKPNGARGSLVIDNPDGRDLVVGKNKTWGNTEAIKEWLKSKGGDPNDVFAVKWAIYHHGIKNKNILGTIHKEYMIPEVEKLLARLLF